MLRKAKEIIKDNWLIGVGIGNYTFALRAKYPEIKVWELQPVHNTYLLILAELGVVGFLFLLLLLPIR